MLKTNDPEALSLLQRAASQTFVAAEEALGIFSQLGYGMPPDKAQAASLYAKAAKHGFRDAATNLALMYSVGDGIPKDSNKAATWFRNAASRSNQAKLISAYKWLVLSEDSVKESASTAEEIRRLLSPEQVAAAEREIDDWRTSHPTTSSRH